MLIHKRALRSGPAEAAEDMTLMALTFRSISHESTRSIFRDCGYGSQYYWRCRLGCIGAVLASEFMGLIWKC
jgi:hypothetical protein